MLEALSLPSLDNPDRPTGASHNGGEGTGWTFYESISNSKNEIGSMLASLGVVQQLACMMPPLMPP